MKVKTPKLKPEDKQQVLVYNPIISIINKNEIKVMRIEMDDEFTRIDFAYHGNTKYKSGSWIRIHNSCFIRPCNTNLKMKMVRAVNIPIAPKMHVMKKNTDSLYYTLYFPSLPKDTESIDIVEVEANDPSYFNFYGVSVQRIKSEVIIISN